MKNQNIFEMRISVLFLLFIKVLDVSGQNGIPYNECYCNPNANDTRFFRVHHFHRIKDHNDFDNKQLISKVCSSAEFPAEIKVSADGTTTTFLEITKESCNFPASSDDPFELVQLDENFEPIGNASPELYGEIEKVSKNGTISYFKYKHPTIGPDEGFDSRTIYVQIESQLEILGFMTISVFRPPLLMVHGLWSNGGAFDDMKSFMTGTGNYQEYQMYSANYESTNDRSFSTNNRVITDGIFNVIKQCQDSMHAAGRVNIVCHSMGGILTRLYMKNPTYIKNKDINRVITCNTPHAGSQMANFLLDSTQYGNYIASVLYQAGMSSYAGAVSDLRVGYPIINGVETASIFGDAKVHAIITTEEFFNSFGFNYFTSTNITSLMLGLIFKHCGNSFLADIFDGDMHDAIVASASQEGGLSASYTSNVSDQVHMGSVANSAVMTKVNEMINKAPGSPNFTNSYGGISIYYTLNTPCLPFRGRDVADDRATADISITSPPSGATVDGGDSITLKYTYSIVDSIMVILRTHPDSVSVLYTVASGDSLLVPTPARLYGPHRLALLGMDADGSILDIDTVTINFGTTATLDSIVMYPEAFYLNQHDSLEFSIKGLYSDGISRNLMFEDSLDFDFEYDRASRQSTFFIRMDSLAGDTLVVSKNGAMSKKIIIHKTGTNYSSNCKMVMNTSPDGAGSLKQALECASEGDTITFSAAIASDTIEIDSNGLIIDKNIYILNTNTAKVYIKSAASAVFNAFAEIDVYMENIGIISENTDPVAITNFGNLTLSNIDCRNLNNMITSSVLNNDAGTITVIGEVNFR